MDRSELSDAIASVAGSDHDAIELIVVNAKGGSHSTVPNIGGNFNLYLINTEGVPLDRAEAANAGLVAAHGEFALFLDDDDLIDACHISRLVTALDENPHHPAAYTGIRLLGRDGKVIRESNIPWSRDRLLGMNFLPIHAVLFRLEPALANCRFDTTLEILEDWDFWLQLSRHGDFVNLPGCSATYRMGLGLSGLSFDRNIGHFLEVHAKVLQKWVGKDGFLPISKSLLWYGTAVENLQIEAASLQLQRLQLQAEMCLIQDELSQVRREHHAVSQIRDALINSTSWKITAPLRALFRWINDITAKHD